VCRQHSSTSTARRGAIGTAVNHAIQELVAVVARAPATSKTREGWLDRLWEAHATDEIPYIERLGDFWGELCVSRDIASAWADRLVGIVAMALSPDPQRHGYFHGTIACLSALLHVGRHAEILMLLEQDSLLFWPYQQWGVRALAALGRTDDAIRYAEAQRGRNDRPLAVARVCEEILLAAGRPEEAYDRYALEASRGTSYLATYRALARKYPDKRPAELLEDLVATTPGDEGKWFAAAKEVGLFDEAIRLANETPCDPRTLTRAARDFADERPTFALEAGLAALRWLVEGHGYEITGADVWAAYANTMKAAEKAGRADETREHVRRLVAGETVGERFVTRILGRALGL
jgi:hypothetical protein